jgi:hypothetical protein
VGISSSPDQSCFLFSKRFGKAIESNVSQSSRATESLLPLAAWDSLVAHNPILANMEPDVEALLVNRVGTKREYYLAPIDVCFELVGLIRVHWRGFSGGEIVWTEIDKFFSRLQTETLPE